MGALVAQCFTAFGTVLVAILAIFGDLFRRRPKLELSVHTPGGELTTVSNGSGTKTPALYYHVRVRNMRKSVPARHVRLVCTKVSRKGPNGTFVLEPETVEAQLCWIFPKAHPQFPIIASEDTCDLGHLVKDGDRFALLPYMWPNNFRGFVSANETICVYLIARADNYTSKKPYILEISWDGIWVDDRDEMKCHLVVKQLDG